MKPHFLLIDDDPDELKILTDALRETAITCKCTWATSPSQALEMLRYLSPDLIFIDYRMPKINGLECMSAIRQLPRKENIPMILYSSEISQELVSAALAIGAVACIKKTSSIPAFAILLKDLLTNEAGAPV